MDDTRRKGRTTAHRLEAVTVYRDRKNLTYAEARANLDRQASAYAIFSVVGTIRDASSSGVALVIEGQQLMSANLLRSGEQYLLKLAILAASEIPEPTQQFVKRSGEYDTFLVKAVCRWTKVGERSDLNTRVGFELHADNPAEVVELFQSCVG